MKKCLLMVLLLMGCVCCAISQEEFIKPVRAVSIGFEAGSSIDWLSTKVENYNHKGGKAGVRYGIPIDINLYRTSSYYYFSTGLKIEHYGASVSFVHTDPFNSAILDAKVTQTFRNIYVSLPTAIKLKSPEFHHFKIIGNVGLLHSILVKSDYRYKVINTDHSTQSLKKLPYKGVFVSKESVFAGIGVEYNFKANWKAYAMFNYSYSFTNFYNKNAENIFDPQVRMKGNLHSVEMVVGIGF
ncbi:MAG: PorT family protein [Bacteroidales bacterium]|jgi:hypothetical protein|nr:PorT family protein [Bacteroidales bacterium]